MDDLVREEYADLLNAYKAFEINFAVYQSFLRQDSSARIGGVSYEDAVDTAQRGLIQACEVWIELCWKYLKCLLEYYETSIPVPAGWREVITKAVHIRVLTESGGELLMSFVKWRNKTSHIYHEEMCDELVRLIIKSLPHMSDVMQKIAPVRSS